MAISAVGSATGAAAANVGGPGHGLPLLRRGPGGRRRPDPGPAPAGHAAGRRRPVPGGRPRRAAGAAHRPPRSAGTAPGRCPSRRARPAHPHGTIQLPHAHRLTARPGRGRRRPRRRARPGAPTAAGRDRSSPSSPASWSRAGTAPATGRHRPLPPRGAGRYRPPAGGTAAFRGLLPAATLGRWRSGLPDAGVLSVGVHGDHMVVRGEGVDLRALPVPATFPAYEDVLAAAGDAHAVVAGRDALTPRWSPSPTSPVQSWCG